MSEKCDYCGKADGEISIIFAIIPSEVTTVCLDRKCIDEAYKGLIDFAGDVQGERGE